MVGDKSLPNDSFVRTWRSALGGQVAESLDQALLLPTDMEHYSSYQDEDLVLKLKWHNIAVSISAFFHPSLFPFSLFFFFPFFFFLFFCLSVSSRFVLILWSLLLLFQATQLTHVVEGWLKGVMEEADKEKALKQVAEATLNEKVLKLATIDRRAIPVERT